MRDRFYEAAGRGSDKAASDVTNLLPVSATCPYAAGWTGAGCGVHRIGTHVTFNGDGLSSDGFSFNNNEPICTVPVGFRPKSTFPVVVVGRNGDNGVWLPFVVQVQYTGYITCYSGAWSVGGHTGAASTGLIMTGISWQAVR